MLVMLDANVPHGAVFMMVREVIDIGLDAVEASIRLLRRASGAIGSDLRIMGGCSGILRSCQCVIGRGLRMFNCLLRRTSAKGQRTDHQSNYGYASD